MMFNELYKEGSICPICSRILLKPIHSSQYDFVVRCENECFIYDVVNTDIKVQIFGVKYASQYSSAKEREDFKELSMIEIAEKIAYWKENDRYLAEILSNK